MIPLRIDEDGPMLGTADLAAKNKTGLKFFAFDRALFLLLSGNISDVVGSLF